MADTNYIIVGGKLLTIIAPEIQTGGVTVRKEVTGKGGDTQTGFAFKVTLSDSSLSGTYGEMVFINGIATFTLKHGESKTATGLPAGVRYSVIKQTANQDGYATTAMGESGTIAENTTKTAVFVNARDAADVPQTGDDSHIEWWLALMSVSLMVLLVSEFGWTRREQK